MSQLLDAIQYAGDSLDKLGGRAIRGVLGGKPREFLSLIPFSDRIPIPGGETLTDPHEIVSGRNLTDQWGLTSKDDKGWGAWGLGAGTEALLDPTTIFGGAALAKRGVKGLASKLRPSPAATRIESVASHIDPAMLDMVGPQYARTPHTLSAALAEFDRNPKFSEHRNPLTDKIRSSPYMDRIASELPPDAVPLGRGEERLAFHVPSDNSVVSMGPVDALGKGITGRPNIPHILQPARAVQYGNHIVERLPMVNPIMNHPGFGDLPFWHRIEELIKQTGMTNPAEAVPAYEAFYGMHKGASDVPGGLVRILKDSVESAHPGAHYWDKHPYNVSLTPGENRLLTHDVGAIEGLPGAAVPNATAQIDSGLLSDLLGRGAAQQARDRIAKGLSAANQGIELPSTFNLDAFMGHRAALVEFLRKYAPDFEKTGAIASGVHEFSPSIGSRSLGQAFGDAFRSSAESGFGLLHPDLSDRFRNASTARPVARAATTPLVSVPAMSWTKTPNLNVARTNHFSRILRRAPDTIRRHSGSLVIGAIGAGQLARTTRQR